MSDFLNGMNVALCAVAGVMFLKFWVETRDRLFLLFAGAFAVMGVSRAVLVLLPNVTEPTSEHTTVIYLVRLVAFSLILLAIIGKNGQRAEALEKASTRGARAADPPSHPAS